MREGLLPYSSIHMTRPAHLTSRSRRRRKYIENYVGRALTENLRPQRKWRAMPGIPLPVRSPYPIVPPYALSRAGGEGESVHCPRVRVSELWLPPGLLVADS